MQLHHIVSAHHKRKKRVGRGGKRGTTAGRGTKGQKSRAGRRIRPQERDLIIRIPKKRGFHNKPLEQKSKTVNVDDINRLVTKKAVPQEISLATLKAVGVIAREYRGKVKVLGRGDIHVPVTLRGLTVSSAAKAKIEKAGGKIIA